MTGRAVIESAPEPDDRMASFTIRRSADPEFAPVWALVDSRLASEVRQVGPGETPELLGGGSDRSSSTATASGT